MRKVLKSAYEGPLTGDEINKRLREVYSNQVNPIAEPEKVRRALKFDERAKKFKGSKRAKHPEGKNRRRPKSRPRFGSISSHRERSTRRTGRRDALLADVNSELGRRYRNTTSWKP